MSEIVWPGGARFALSIIDDTDSATVATVRPIYDLLTDLGFRTTKTVWPLASAAGTPLAGDTLEDNEHRAWILELQRRGFEIAYHGASAAPSERPRSELALRRFREVLGHDVGVYASHAGQREAMYWGASRLSGLPARAFAAVNRLLDRDIRFYGEDDGSPYFWGDLCRAHVTYTRNFTFNDIDTLACDRRMPYHDPAKPYVRYWFSASNAPQGDAFCHLLGDANQDRLLASGGACLAYTHFAYGFVVDGRVRGDLVRSLERLRGLPGWFATTSEILDHLRTVPGRGGEISKSDAARMQWRWIADNVRTSRGRRYVRQLARTMTRPLRR